MRFATFVSTIVLAILFLLCISSIAYATPPGGYTYVKTHNIIGSSDGALSNYQIKLIVHSGTGVDDSQDVYLNGHSLSWPYDIRFTNANDVPLSYWIESYDANIATLWVKVDNLPASPTTTQIKIYYGKPNDIDASDGQSTFPFYDHFTGHTYNTNKWIQDGNGQITVSNSELIISRSNIGGNYAANVLDSNNVAFGSGYGMCVRYKSTSVGDEGNFGFSNTNTGYEVGFWDPWNYNDIRGRTRTGSMINSQYATLGYDMTNYHVYMLKWYNSSSVKFWYDGIYSFELTDYIPTSTLPVMISCWSGNPGPVYYDYIYVFKVTGNEPTQGAWGNETIAQPLIPSWLLIAIIIIVLLFIAAILIIAATFIIGYMMGKGKNK